MHARCHFKQSNLCHDNSHAGQKISMIVSDPVDIGTRTNCRVGREDCTFDFEEREGPSLFFGRSLESKLGSFISFRLFCAFRPRATFFTVVVVEQHCLSPHPSAVLRECGGSERLGGCQMAFTGVSVVAAVGDTSPWRPDGI